MSDSFKVAFTANPTQRRFIESQAEADLFDCRKGEGKSAALVWACFYHTKHNPGATSLFIRDTWENLRRTTLQEFFHWFPPGVFGTWKAGDKEFIWDTEKTGLKGKVVFMGVETEEDASKVASMPLAAVYIDEPSAAAGESTGVSEFVFDTAMAQLRQPGMRWYAVKLAQNNPDESHWTYRRFWDPGTPPTPEDKLLPDQASGFKAWQTREPENVQNLPPGYYERMARAWADRPDLIRRFVEGKHGYQQVGKAVTPEWADELHLCPALEPVKGVPLQLLWDGGLNATCLITQVTPLGDWLVLESHVSERAGTYELITDVIKPRLATRFDGFEWRHIGDPTLANPDQSSLNNSAVRVIKKEIGGTFIGGPVREEHRIEPLRAVLRRTRDGRGVVRVDRERARDVWYALRGGWHYHITRTGQLGGIVKDHHSHPGDCMGYGASKLYPLGELKTKAPHGRQTTAGGYFRSAPGGGKNGTSLGMARKGARLPREAKIIGGGDG